MTKGYKCNGCGNFTVNPIKVKYPNEDKKLDYLGARVNSSDMQDDEPSVEHYCEACGEKIHSIGEDDE